MIRFLKIVLAVILFAPISLMAKEERMLFSHYMMEDGLCSNATNDIVQDSMGFTWIATVNGVSRFDGSHFVNYTVDQYPEILTNDLKRVFILPNGKLTVSSSRSVLSSYDYETNTFSDVSGFMEDTSYKYDINNYVTQKDGRGLLATAQGVYRFDRESNQFVHILPELMHSYVLDVTTDFLNRYWVLDYDGVCVLDENGEALSAYNFKPQMKEMIEHHLWLDDYHLLLSSPVGSLWIVELDRDGTIHSPRKVALPFRYVSCMVKDSMDMVWMGTLGDGLWQVTFKEGKTDCVKIIPTNENEDALAKISSLYLDGNNNLWVSSLATGVWKTSRFSDSPYVTANSVGIPSTIGSCFSETAEGDILFGTDGMGLFWLDSHFQIIKNFNVSNGLSSNNIITIAKQSDGSFLIGYWGGVTDRIWLHTGKIEKVTYTGIDHPIFTTKSILPTKDGSLYVATSGNGVYANINNQWQRIFLRDSTMNPYDDIWCDYLMEDPAGNVRIITSRTIWSNLTTHSKTQFRPIFPDADKTNTRQPLHFSHALFHDSLYVTSNQGIYVFNAEDSLIRIIEGDYSSILMDNQQRLWVAGANGIQTLPTDGEKQVSITSSEFHHSNHFISHASFISSSGNLFFGCRDGFVCVNPTYSDHHTHHFFSFSRIVSSHGESWSCSPSSPVKLKYDDTHIKLYFDLVDYSLKSKESVYYRIVELDSAWIDLAGKREIEISYLPTGTFTVELSASFMNEKQVQKITVLPPWWNTTLFRLILVVLLLGLIYLIICVKTRRVERQKAKLSEMVAIRTEELRLVNENLSQKNEEIERRNKSLLESLKEKNQLVSVIGHDLKNPMFAIVTTLKRLLTKQYSLSEQQTILSNVTRESESLQNEMLKLLQWSAESGMEMTFQPQNFDMPSLVSETVSFLNGLLSEKNIELTVDEDCQNLTYADPRMVSTVIRNLLTNAIKFTPSGKSITVKINDTEEETAVRIIDQGVGMSSDQIENLLKGSNHFSSKGTEEEMGFGLGFQIVTDFVDKNNGTIKIESVLNEGSDISVYFPKSQEQRVKEDTSDNQVPVTVNDDELLQGKSILVVDDDPLLLSHVSELLSNYVTVYQAGNGEDAVRLAMEKIPDLIVSDIEMPKMNGMEMYEQLKRNLLSANIPLIFLSAKSDIEVRRQSMSLGAINFIAKPFEDNELLMQIVNFLSWQQKTQIQMLSRTIEEKEVPKDDINPLLDRLMEVIKENYKNPEFSFNDIAKGMGMSKSTLARRLKSLTNKSPIEILSEYRFSLAKRMVEKGDMPISEIAYSVGFNDPSYFSRRFKELYGVTPTSQKK